MSGISWILVAVAVATALFIFKKVIGGQKMSTGIVQQTIKSGAKIIDVRTREEYREGSYPGSINIPLSDIGKRMNEIPKEKAVVLYCQSGARSAMAARALKRAGYTNVINAGGLSDMPR